MASISSRGLEPLLAAVAERVGEVAVECEHRILRQRVDAEMEAFNWFAASGDALECLFELGQVLHLDHQMELAERRRSQAELAACEPPTLDQTLLLQMAHIAGNAVGECR